MKQNELDEVLLCLGDDRKIIHYFKDRYCLDFILSFMHKHQRSALPIHELKKLPINRFANKAIVKEIIKLSGNGLLTDQQLQTYWPKDFLTLTLSLDRWGDGDRGYDQTSRNQQNLVLQINFDNRHNQAYYRLLKPYDSYGPFEYWGHPVSMDKGKTLSWVRIDMDFSTGEALIEEVQNDWLRKVNACMARVDRRRSIRSSIKPGDIIYGIRCEYHDLQEYANSVLKPYHTLWAELSLWVAIRFIREELGLNKIYYHTFETGRKIKKIHNLPPKSIYTKLPEQFGFKETDCSPLFLQQHKQSKRYLKAIKQPKWYLLQL